MKLKSKLTKYNNIAIIFAVSTFIILVINFLFSEKLEKRLHHEVQLYGVIDKKYNNENFSSSYIENMIDDLRIRELSMNSIDLRINTLIQSPICKKNDSKINKPIIDRIGARDDKSYSIIFKIFFTDKNSAINCSNAILDLTKNLNETTKKNLFEYQEYLKLEFQEYLKNGQAIDSKNLNLNLKYYYKSIINLKKKNIDEFDFVQYKNSIYETKTNTVSILAILYIIIFIVLFALFNFKLIKKIISS